MVTFTELTMRDFIVSTVRNIRWYFEFDVTFGSRKNFFFSYVSLFILVMSYCIICNLSLLISIF